MKIDIYLFSGIDDTTGAITDVFQDKYFRTEEVGNFTAMVPGLIDVIIYLYYYFICSSKFIIS